MSWFGRKQAALPLPKPEVVETAATPLVIEAKTQEIEAKAVDEKAEPKGDASVPSGRGSLEPILLPEATTPADQATVIDVAPSDVAAETVGGKAETKTIEAAPSGHGSLDSAHSSHDSEAGHNSQAGQSSSTSLDVKAQALERTNYFTPCGYTPIPSRVPRLIAPSRSASDASAVMPNAPRDYFARSPAAAPPPTSLKNEQLRSTAAAALVLYLLSREGDPRLDESAWRAYLREPDLLAGARRLGDAAIENWYDGKAPWNLAEFQEAARGFAPDSTAALLLCHNVAKSFARGGAAIAWTKIDRVRGEYSDGARAWSARALHPSGRLVSGPFTPPSMFFLLFSTTVFGTDDPGDWARYFASATLTAFTATDRLITPAAVSPALTHWVTLLEPALRGVNEDRAWRMAAFASFHELEAYGRKRDTNEQKAQVQQSGAKLGLAVVGKPAPRDAEWRVPDPIHTPRTVASGLLESIVKAARRPVGSTMPVQLLCTIEEGVACRFATGTWNDSETQALAERVVDAIGWNFLEHASRRQVSLRVTATSCEIDYGNGYQAMEVRLAL